MVGKGAGCPLPDELLDPSPGLNPSEALSLGRGLFLGSTSAVVDELGVACAEPAGDLDD